MNVLVTIKGLGNVDFNLRGYGWVRDPMMEFCGIDDADMCEKSVSTFISNLCPVPFENIVEGYVDTATADLKSALDTYESTKQAVKVDNAISIAIIPTPKSSRDASLKEIAEFAEKLEQK